MIKYRKSISVILAILMMFSYMTPIFAEGVEDPIDTAETEVEEFVEDSSESEVEDLTEDLTVEDSEVEPTEVTETNFNIYEANDAADMLSAVSTLSDDISSRVIVTTQEDLSEVIDSSGTAVYYDGTYIIDFEDSDQMNDALEKLADVDAEVIPEERFVIMENEDNPIEIDPAQAESAKEGMTVSENTNKKVVALIDTGVNIDVAASVNLTNDPDPDVKGHGTLMANTMLDTAEGQVEILSIKAFNDDGTALLSNIYAAFVYAVEAKVDIINLSATMRDSSNTSLIKEIINQAVDSGILVVTAAGNYGSDTSKYFPANMENVIVVGAATADGRIASFSNTGDTVDYYVYANSTSEATAKMSGFLARGVIEDGIIYKAELFSEPDDPTPTEPEEPYTGSITISYRDRFLGEEGPQGDATLAGATFEIYAQPQEHLQSQTSDDPIATVQTDEFGEVTVNDLDAGDYLVVLVEAPRGYLFEETQQKITLPSDDSTLVFTGDIISGGLRIEKIDAERFADMDNSPNYPDVPQGDATLSGAEFTIYLKSTNPIVPGRDMHVSLREVNAIHSGEVVTILRTDKRGFADTGDLKLPYGSYYLVETKAPQGYKINDTRIDFVIREDGEVVEFVHMNSIQDEVIRGGIEVTTYDADRYYQNMDNPNTPQGDATLAGAEYSIYNLSYQDVLVEDTWYGTSEGSDIPPIDGPINPIVKSVNKMYSMTVGDMSEETFYEEELAEMEPYKVVTIVTDENGHASTGESDLPYGYYLIIQTKASEGYQINRDWYANVEVYGDGTIVDVNDIRVNTNKVIRGGAEFADMVDSERQSANRQGNGLLNGAEIALFSISENDIYAIFDHSIYEPTEPMVPTVMTLSNGWFDPISDIDTSVEPKNVDLLHGENDPRNLTDLTPITILTTDENGQIELPEESLPYGSYIAIQVKPSEGYMLNTQWKALVTVRDNAQVTVTEPLEEQIIRGGVRVYKYDAELNDSQSLGNHGKDVNLNDIEFTITNKSQVSILSEDLSQEYAPGELVVKIKTHYEDGKYIAETNELALPYGEYLIQETKTNNAYQLTDGEPRTFRILANGEMVDFDIQGEELIFTNQIIRGGIKFTKIAGDTREGIQTIWVLKNNTTGEEHIIVTDENGQFSSISGSNDNDSLLDEIASGPIDLTDKLADSELVPTSGIWFGLGENGDMAEVNSELNPLPYGSYTLTEVSSDTNSKYELIDVNFDITSDEILDLGTLVNNRLAPKHQVIIRNTDEKDNLLSGISMSLIDGETMEVVDTWVSNGEPHDVSELIEEGKSYLIKQNSTLKGHYYPEDVIFIIDGDVTEDENFVIDMVSNSINLVVSKVDDAGNYVSGAVLELYDNDTLLDSWTTDSSNHRISSFVEVGKTYRIVEKEVPNGYFKATETSFTLPKIGSGSQMVITVTDQPGYINFIKRDSLTGKQLSGATYAIFSLNDGYAESDLSGKTVAELKQNQIITEITTFETLGEKSQSKTVDNKDIASLLKTDKVYYFQEVKAPFGYELDPIAHKFTLSENIKTVAEVTNKPMTVYVEITKVDQDKKTTVLKGAEISIVREDGTIVKTTEGKDAIGITNDKGIVTFAIPYDAHNKYFVKETKAPNGYQLTKETIEIKVSNDYIFKNTDPIKVQLTNKTVTPDPVKPVNTGVGQGLVYASLILILASTLLVIVKRRQYTK